MKRLFCLAFFFDLMLSFPLCGRPAMAQGNLTILCPADGKFANEAKDLAVVCRVSQGSFDSITISVNGFIIKKIDPLGNKVVFCARADVEPGINNIQVSALEGDKVAASQRISVFVRSTVSQFNAEPDGYGQYLFHSTRSDCFLCHKMEPAETDAYPDKPTDSSCYVCHKGITAHAYVHGPAATWSCLTCHDPKTKYIVASPVSRVCGECHQDTIDAWHKMKHMHGPTAMGMCTACHNPHGSDWQYWLRKFPTDLCQSCHVGMTGNHIITFFNGEPHPVRGVPDPRRPGQQLSCASCHNPHASNYEYMLFDNHNYRKFCTSCHKF